jgi:hypothetical protein
MPVTIPEPWLSFLRDVGRGLGQPVEVHCLGGFVLTVLWGLPRPTGDIDFIEIEPSEAGHELLGVAGEGSELAKRHKLQFHRVTVAEHPEGYASRLVDIAPRGLFRLRLRALEVHDLVLAKLARNSPRDRADVEFLVRQGALDRQCLEDRFEKELRPHLLNEDRETATLKLWMEEYFDE